MPAGNGPSARDSLCAALAARAKATLERSGHTVVQEDLCADGFPPALTAAERRSYYGPTYDDAAVREEVDRLRNADAVVLVFPTWWFSFPAVLKGWFDRVWGPGVAYDHASDFGPIRPRLHTLGRMLAVTTLGSPWWVDHLVMRRPVRRVLRRALLGTCAPKCRFEMLSFYRCESLSAAQVGALCNRVDAAVGRW